MPAVTWNGATADWNTPSDWSNGIGPGLGDTAVLPAASAYTVTISSNETTTVTSVLITGSAATLGLHNSSGSGHGASLTVHGGFSNNGTLYVDAFSGEGGSSLTVDGTLANTGIAVTGPGNLNL
ncbi:MAG TPA: hypothetical protein VKI44_32595, partial [Acetobacteraceae bacterium]|nr:hypothetical protein [Acetobacteraceae bacterium]